MARVFSGERTFLDPLLRPVERLVYRLAGIDENREMRWTEYTVSMLLFSGVSMALLYLIERTQKSLPFNQAPDRGGDQANQERDQHGKVLRRSAVNCKRLQADHREQKNDGEAGEQNVERDFVGRLLA